MASRTQAGDKYLTDENCAEYRANYRIIKEDTVIPKASPNGSIHEVFLFLFLFLFLFYSFSFFFFSPLFPADVFENKLRKTSKR